MVEFEQRVFSPSYKREKITIAVFFAVVVVFLGLLWALESVPTPPPGFCERGVVLDGECYIPPENDPGPGPREGVRAVLFLVKKFFWCLGGESHTRPLPLQGNALLLSYPGILLFQNLSTF